VVWVFFAFLWLQPKDAVALRNFLSNLSRNAVVKQVAGPCSTLQSFPATFNIFDRGKLKTPRTQIDSEQNNEFAHAFVERLQLNREIKASTNKIIVSILRLFDAITQPGQSIS